MMGTEAISNCTESRLSQNHASSSVKKPGKSRSGPGSPLGSSDRSLDVEGQMQVARKGSMAYVTRSTKKSRMTNQKNCIVSKLNENVQLMAES